MKIIIITQKIDKNDTVLGFFHTWLTELSTKFESVEVICLEKGKFDLPKNVTVYSLGKERGISKISFVKNLYKYLFLISGTYDRVFVHMNEEYVLLAGLYWKLKGIPVYLWRNHPKGSLKTRLAVAMSTKVFCTSKSSFTAKFSKTVIMPAGINTKIFKPVPGVVRQKYSVCMVGRISPVKRIEVALHAIKILSSHGVQVSLSVIGPVATKDLRYFESLKKYVLDNNLSKTISWKEAVSPEKLPEIYSGYEICLNLTPSGSFDKTIVEASACGTVPLVSNSSLSDFLPTICITGTSPDEVAESIQRLLEPKEQVKIQDELKSFIESQSLKELVDRLVVEIK